MWQAVIKKETGQHLCKSTEMIQVDLTGSNLNVSVMPNSVLRVRGRVQYVHYKMAGPTG